MIVSSFPERYYIWISFSENGHSGNNRSVLIPSSVYYSIIFDIPNTEVIEALQKGYYLDVELHCRSTPTPAQLFKRQIFSFAVIN